LRSVAEINLSNLIYNFNYINSHIDQSKIMAVVKANAYGHGVSEVSQVLTKIGVYGLCVAIVEELEEIRKSKIDTPILHLGALDSNKIEVYQKQENLCTINSFQDIELINSFLEGTRQKIFCHLKLDTGMGRLGIDYNKSEEALKLIKSSKGRIVLRGVYSHLASSDESDTSFMNLQLDRFSSIIDLADMMMPEERDYHISNSCNLLRTDFRIGNIVRPGISLYGVNTSPIDHKLKPVMKLKAPIVLLKNINKGSSIGYNRKFIAKKNMRVGYVQIGYADGYPVEMMNSTWVHCDSKLVSVIGKVSMDITAIDCTDINVDKGDWVTLFGEHENRIESICSSIGENVYSVLTGISKRVARKYLYE